jgi:hypothetical protein
MKRYTIHASVTFEVQASNEDEARDLAIDMLPFGVVIGADVIEEEEIGEAEA